MMTCLTRLGDVCELINGGAWKQNEYVDDGIPVVQVSNMKKGTIDISDLKFLPTTSYDRYKKHSLKECDLVIATVGSHATQASAAGRATIIKEFAAGMLLNQNAVSIRSKSKSLDQDYLGLIARSNDFQFYLGTVGQGAANQVRIALSSIKEYKCVLPPIGIQRRMVEIISAYDDLIENNRRRIQLLEQAARLLYKEWFVHLRFPGHEHVKIVDGVPEGWEKKLLFDIASPTYGFAFKSKLFNTDNEGLPIARIRDIPSGKSQTYTIEEAPKEKLLEDGDFVIGMDGDFHMNFWTGGKTWINQRVVRIKGTGGVSDAFLRYACEKPVQDFNATIVGTTVAHLGAKHLKIIEILIPPKGILYDAQDFFDSTQSQIVALSNQIRLAKNASDILLPRLMNGELAV